jgi:hypothetical protein
MPAKIARMIAPSAFQRQAGHWPRFPNKLGHFRTPTQLSGSCRLRVINDAAAAAYVLRKPNKSRACTPNKEAIADLYLSFAYSRYGQLSYSAGEAIRI